MTITAPITLPAPVTIDAPLTFGYAAPAALEVSIVGEFVRITVDGVTYEWPAFRVP